MYERKTPRSEMETREILYNTIEGNGWLINKNQEVTTITRTVEGCPEPQDIIILITPDGAMRICGLYGNDNANINGRKELLSIVQKYLNNMNQQLKNEYKDLYTLFKVQIRKVFNLFSLEAYIDFDYRYLSAMDLSSIILFTIHSQELLYKRYCKVIPQKREQILTEWQNSGFSLSASKLYKSNANTNTNNSGSGCYIATAVYGSYDCPEVWTLRRYRDYTLAKTWYGRAFIKTYYAISPSLVKWFGNTDWFKKVWQRKLDRMVANLQANGVESTPYEDKNW